MTRLILVEGKSDKEFFDHLIAAHRLRGFKVEFKADRASGSGAFEAALRAIRIERGYEDVTLVVIAADCDINPRDEFQKVVKQIRSASGYPIPTCPRNVFEAPGQKSISVLMLPWDEEIGALETVCYDLAAKRRPTIGKCITKFIDCVGAREWNAQQLAKLKIKILLGAACPKDPFTPLSNAWNSSDNRRPKDLIPLVRKNKMLMRVVEYLQRLP